MRGGVENGGQLEVNRFGGMAERQPVLNTENEVMD